MALITKGKISIPNVTGNLVINISAVAQGPHYTNIWEVPYKLNARLNSSETDPVQNGAFISAWFPITAQQMAGDIVLRSNLDIFNYQTSHGGNGDYFRLYPSMTAGSQLMYTTVSGEKLTYDATTGIYTFRLPHSDFEHFISQAKYFRWCAQVSTSAITSSFFDGCILTLNEEIA